MTFLATLLVFILTALAINGIAWIWFEQRYNLGEVVAGFVLPVSISSLVYALSYTLFLTLTTSDNEFWGGYIVRASYEEPWDEEVPCRHPRFCETTDSEGHTTTYMCGFEHLYDVDYHGPQWYFQDNNGIVWATSKERFDGLCRKWSNKSFVDMHRSYHSKDGDKYITDYDAKEDNIEPTTSSHSYKNRAKFTENFRHISAKEARSLGLFDYPRMSWHGGEYPISTILGTNDRAAVWAGQVLNAKVGRDYQCFVWILQYDEKPHSVFKEQFDFWKGGNKNELVIGVGTDEDGKITWADSFSWSVRDDFVIRCRDKLGKEIGKKPDLVSYCKWLETEIPKGWERRKFSEFNYVNIETPLDIPIYCGFINLIATCTFVIIHVRKDVDYLGYNQRK